MSALPPRRVILESPYAPHPDRPSLKANIQYARDAVRDSLMRGEAPLARHLLYTQEGVLDDTNPAERNKGIEAGFVWGGFAEATVVYTDLGISYGMRLGIDRALREGRKVEYRQIIGKRRR